MECDHLEVWRRKTEFLHECVNATLGPWCDQHVDRQTEHSHERCFMQCTPATNFDLNRRIFGARLTHPCFPEMTQAF